MDLITLLLAVAAMSGLYMAWNIGANDVANAMGTSVGSGALNLRFALVAAAACEFGGSMLVGGSVTRTISGGIVDATAFGEDPIVLAAGMTCCLVAAAVWIHIATAFGWPVSTTHSIVAAIVGFGITSGGIQAIHWLTLAQITLSWIISPCLGALVAFLLFVLIRKRIHQTTNPIQATQRWGPLLILPVFTVLALSMMYEGLGPLRVKFHILSALAIALGFGAFMALVSIPILRHLVHVPSEDSRRTPVERLFLMLQVVTACYVAFAHGSNDIANAVGPLAAAFSAIRYGITTQVELPNNIMLIGAVGIVIGLATYGYKVMATIGREITELTPSQGFCAEFAAATTILVASQMGLPISTTHTVVGAVVGVGIARSTSAINTQVMKGILASWFVTVPFAAIFSAILFLLVRRGL